MEVIQNKKQDDLKTQIPRSTDSGYLHLLWPEGRPYSDQRVRPFITDYFCWLVVVCVRFSSETTLPINSGNSVDVQRALHFDLDPSMTAG